MSTVMWEARAAAGRLEDLIAFVEVHADAGATVYRADGPQPRVVVIDPSGAGIRDVPPDLVARPPHQWAFEEVPRQR